MKVLDSETIAKSNVLSDTKHRFETETLKADRRANNYLKALIRTNRKKFRNYIHSQNIIGAF